MIFWKKKNPLPEVRFDFLGDPYLSYDHPIRETKEFVMCLNAWRSAQRKEINQLGLDLAWVKRQLEEIANPIRPASATTYKMEWANDPITSLRNPTVETVAKFLKRCGIDLAYDDRFLEAVDHRVLGFPTEEEIEAWKKLMELAQ